MTNQEQTRGEGKERKGKERKGKERKEVQNTKNKKKHGGREEKEDGRQSEGPK